MKICNAFERTTKNNKKVFRIHLDNNEILSNLEQGKTHICIDLITQNGMVKTISRTGAKGPYKAVMYYTWAQQPIKKEEEQK